MINNGRISFKTESDPSPNPRMSNVNRGTFNSANESDPSPSPTIKTLVAN
jgi:hypothetical protein